MPFFTWLSWGRGWGQVEEPTYLFFTEDEVLGIFVYAFDTAIMSIRDCTLITSPQYSLVNSNGRHGGYHVALMTI